jgi:exocyst complex component 4
MTDDNCVPVQISLKLLDSSSLGLSHRYDMFRETHLRLQSSLKAIVNGN